MSATSSQPPTTQRSEQRNGSGQGYGHGGPQYGLVNLGSRYPWSVPFLNRGFAQSHPEPPGGSQGMRSRVALHWPSASAPVAPRPCVKITAWRILNTSVLFVLGTYKAVATYLGETAVPTNLDWMIGVVWALMCAHTAVIEAYLVSIVEQEAPSIAPWFFTTDWSRRRCLGEFIGHLRDGNFDFPSSNSLDHGHAILVVIAGLLLQMLIGLGILALLMAYGTQLRRLYNTVRIPRFYDTLFHSSDWLWQGATTRKMIT
ncbi:hypothetical protein DFH08DRAFT_816424 [Mycena albidolilacea]|uniref:Uncharacterized protein n=1 Tax=Mycena albidolilacea TaxID=1033008 RepID=A0AAD6ZL29_9AGAR|nr:hypothetical protein DFH08DRAFT_816424 [Mycena albidolilacea]